MIGAALRCQFHIEAEPDLHLASQLLALVSVRNELPERFSLVKDGGQLRIVLETRHRDEPGIRRFLELIQRIPAVMQVTCVRLPGLKAA